MKKRIIKSRKSAGQHLAKKVKVLLGRGNKPVVISLPRGGVVVGLEIAKALKAPHDVVITRKICEEKKDDWTIGALADDGSEVWYESMKAKERPVYLKKAVAEAMKEATRRLRIFRRAIGPMVSLKGKTIVIADDGMFRGYTMLAAIKQVWNRGAKRVIVAVPVASRRSKQRLQRAGGELVVLHTPMRFLAVGSYYFKGHFDPVPTQEVSHLLREYRLSGF